MSFDKKNSWQIFEKIAKRYDTANRVLSLGIDKRWRKKVVSLIPSGSEVKVLDLATGTGDLLLEIIQNRPKVSRAVGVDMSPQMLLLGEKKSLARKLYGRCSFRIGDATSLYFKDGEWDWVTMAFGIRNVDNPLNALMEMHRVLKPNGKAVVLEFSLPSSPWFRKLYLFYFRYILPLFGYIITGRYSAYRYLNATVEDFPYGEAFLELMKQAGFRITSSIPLTWGIATIYVGQK